MPLNLYADIAAFQGRFANSMTLDAGDLAQIERVLEAGSRRADDFCKRKFFAATQTRVFPGTGCAALRIPDLISLTSISLDEDADGVFELALTTLTPDYYLEREFYEDVDATPKTLVRLNPYGARSFFVRWPRVVQIVGRWGYGADTERESVTATLADATTTALATSGPGALAVGQTVAVEGEDIYIVAGNGTAWTVKRAVNGTPAAGHAAKPIDRYVYVPEVREAALIIAGRLWKRRDTAYSNVIANPVVGQFEVYRAVDPDVAELLWPLVRAEVR